LKDGSYSVNIEDTIISSQVCRAKWGASGAL